MMREGRRRIAALLLAFAMVLSVAGGFPADLRNGSKVSYADEIDERNGDPLQKEEGAEEEALPAETAEEEALPAEAVQEEAAVPDSDHSDTSEPVIFRSVKRAAAAAVNASEVGTPIVSDAVIALRGEALSDGMTAAEGDGVTMRFDWRIVNNEDIYTYKVDLNLHNIRIDQNEKTGDLIHRDEKIGTFVIDDSDPENVSLWMYLDKDKTEYMSNIGGGVILSGTVNLSDDRSEPDGKEFELGFLNKVNDVIYDNKGNVSMKKSSGGFYQDDGKTYIDYTIKLSYREIMKGITIGDTVADGTVLDTSSIQVSSGGKDVTDDAEYVSDIAADAAGFVISLPDSTGKKSQHDLEVAYRVSLENAVGSSAAASSYTNDATLDYTDENGEPKDITSSVTDSIKGPKASKTGHILVNGDKEAYYFKAPAGNSPKSYATLYTITISPNDYADIVDGTTPVSIDDHLSVETEKGGNYSRDSIFYQPSQYMNGFVMQSVLNGSPSTGAFYNFLKDGDGNAVTSSAYGQLKYADERGNLTAPFASDADVLKALQNTAKIFGIEMNGGVKEGTQNLTLDDFTYNAKDDTYEISYLVLVPADDAAKVEYENTFTGDLLGQPLSGNVKTTYQTPPVDILVKGPDALSPDHYQEETRTYTYSETVPAGEEKSTVSYKVIVDLGRFRYEYDGNTRIATKTLANWQTDVIPNIGTIKLTDILNGRFGRNGNTGDITQSSGTGNGILQDSVRLEIYTIDQVSGGVVTLTNEQQFKTAKDNLNFVLAEAEEFVEKYGTLNNPKEGFDQNTFNDLYSRINAATAAYNNASPYAIDYATMAANPDLFDVSLTSQGLTVSVKFADGARTNSIPFYKDTYNYNGGLHVDSNPLVIHNVGSPRSFNLTSLVGGNYGLVLSYDAAIQAQNSTSQSNAAKVTFGNKDTSKEDPYPSDYVNSSISVTVEKEKEPEGTVTFSKAGVGTASTSTPRRIAFSDRTFDYNSSTSIGWRLLMTVTDARADDTDLDENGKLRRTIVLKDTLPDGLKVGDLSSDENFILFWTTSNSDSQNSVSYEEAALPAGAYTVSAENGEVTITIPYTEELEARFGTASKKYIVAYLRTDVDSAKYVNNGGNVAFTNRYSGTFADSTTSGSASATMKYDKPLVKEATDEDYSGITGIPVVEDNTVYGYYRITVNPMELDLVPDEEQVKIEDVMTPKMILDTSSVKAVDQSGAEISVSVEQDGSRVLFTVPDSRKVIITYRVRFDVNPIRESDWTGVETTKNSCSIVGTAAEQVPADSVDFSSYKAEISVWVYETNGDVTIGKRFWDKAWKPGAEAHFELRSVYDNNGETYADAAKDKAYSRYADIVTDSNGEKLLENLALDVIYKLTEIQAPEGCLLDDTPHYFYLEGDFGIDWSAVQQYIESAGLGIDVEDIAIIGKDGTVTIDDKKAVSIDGKKVWRDSSDVTGSVIRPDDIEIRLYRYTDNKAEAQEVPVSEYSAGMSWNKPAAGNEWTYTVENLPAYDDDRNEYTYYVREIDVKTGYEVSYAQNDTDIINTLITTSVSGTKTWVGDADYKDIYRPETIGLTLYADGNKVQESAYSVSWTKDGDTWSYEIADLPLYSEAGEEIVYTVEEDSVPGYTASYSADQLDITNTLRTTSINGKKTWNDQDDQDGLRPGSVTIKLYANNVEFDSAAVSARDGWSFSFDELPELDTDGNKITYTVDEVLPEGYTKRISGDAENGYIIHNTHQTYDTSVTVRKVWSDEADAEGIRPDDITAILLADGTEIDRQILSEDNNWSHTWESLPLRKAGSTIIYSVEEADTPDGYTADIQEEEAGSFVITNQHIVERTSIGVSKLWEDDANRDGIRPDAISVYLVRNGIKDENPVILNEANGWSHTWGGLLKKYNNEEIIYTIDEVEVPGYTVSLTDEASTDGKVYKLTNTHHIDTVSISVEKNWIDDENRDGIRPDSLEVRLVASVNGQDIERINESAEAKAVLSADNDWSYTWDELPMREDGSLITYTVVEEEVPAGYEGEEASSVTGQSGELKLVNTHGSEKLDISVSKEWVDHDDLYEFRPDEITFVLLADGEEIAEKTATADDNWSAVFTDLHKYKEGEEGVEIEYAVEEREITYYEASVREVEAAEGRAFMVTNTFNKDYGDLSFTKYGTYLEEPVDVDAARLLSGAKFAAFAAEDPETEVAEALSGSDGVVSFENLPVGHYIIREKEAPKNYILSDTEYYAEVTPGTFKGLTDADGNLIADNSITNDIFRSEIVLKKVSREKPGTTLPDSEYGLFRKNTDGSTTEIASAVTDEEGIIRFAGVLADTEYIVSEKRSPDGYYVSELPITVKLLVSQNGDVNLEIIDDGSGTVYLDEDGNITWLEPEVVVSFAKLDADTKAYLANAKLRTTDEDGNIIEEWTTTGEKHVAEGLYSVGKTYILHEVEAPDGYQLAQDVSFTVENVTVGPEESITIEVVMEDKQNETLIITDGHEEKTTSDTSVRTGDSNRPILLLMASLLSLAAVMILLILKKKERR